MGSLTGVIQNLVRDISELVSVFEGIRIVVEYSADKLFAENSLTFWSVGISYLMA